MSEPPPRAPGLGAGDAAEMARLQKLQDAVAPGFFQYQRFLEEVAIIVGGWASITLEVFTRKDFGERYMTPFRLMLGAVVYGVYASIFGGLEVASSLAAGRGVPGDAAMLVLFFLLFMIAGAVHLFEIFYRNHYTDRVWHSRSFGVAWPFRRLLGYRLGPLPPADEWFIYLYAEPWAWFLLGGLLVIGGLVFPTYAVGQWIVLASLALFTKNQLVYTQERDQELNLSDAQIEAAARRASADGAPMEATGGYKVITLPRAVDANRDGTPDDEADIMSRFLRPQSKQEEKP